MGLRLAVQVGYGEWIIKSCYQIMSFEFWGFAYHLLKMIVHRKHALPSENNVGLWTGKEEKKDKRIGKRRKIKRIRKDRRTTRKG